MAKMSQARKALKKTPGYRKVGSTAKGNLGQYPGESDRPAVDSGVDVESIDRAFGLGQDEPKEKPAKRTRGRAASTES